jgi:D-ribulokinase
MAGLFLGIDVGTGGVRACAIDPRGDIQAMESAALPPPRQDGDAIDQDPELWWQATVSAISKLSRHRSRMRRTNLSGWNVRHASAD